MALRARTLPAAVLAMVIVVGCSSSSRLSTANSGAIAATTTTANTGGSNGVVSSTATSDSSSSAAPSTTTAPAPSFGPGTVDLPDPAVGLDGLTSHTATLTVTFDGTKDGAPLKVTRSSVLVAATAPIRRMLTTDPSAAGSTPDVRVIANGFLFTRDDGGACAASSASAAADDPQGVEATVDEPVLAMSGFIGGVAAGVDTIDGIAVDHTTFDESALGLADTSKVSGEAWVATDGGYVVRYSLVSTGPAAFLGQGVDGVLNIDYALSAVNAPVSIALPADCPEVVDAPLTADATNVDAAPGAVSYVSATGVLDVLAFYQSALAPAGWQASTALPIIAAEGGRLGFVRGTDKLTVVVVADPAGSRVLLLQSPLPA